jgi:hypothetical protein
MKKSATPTPRYPHTPGEFLDLILVNQPLRWNFRSEAFGLSERPGMARFWLKGNPDNRAAVLQLTGPGNLGGSFGSISVVLDSPGKESMKLRLRDVAKLPDLEAIKASVRAVGFAHDSHMELLDAVHALIHPRRP